MTKISVIIPIYNTASYLKECLDSVLNQSFEDIEVICVNDGSNDSSLEVLKSYKSKDDRVRIINQENKGIGAARNIAISYAKGKYILFLDSDDYLEENSLIELYELAEMKSLDLLMFKIINFDENTYKKTKFHYFEMKFLKNVEGLVFDWRHVKDRLFDISVTCPGKLFRRDFIKNIRFPEGLIFEDNVFFFNMIFKAKRIYFYEKYLYYRRIRKDSITNSYFNQFTDCITIYDFVEDSIRKSNKYSIFSKQLFNRKCKDIFSRFSMVDEKYKQDFFKKIRGNFLKHNKHLKNEGVLENCSKRSLIIFSSAINSQTYKEFELSVNFFDLKRSRDKQKLNYDISKRRYQDQIRDLKKERDEYLQEIENLKDSTSWRATSIFRSLGNSLKK